MEWSTLNYYCVAKCGTNATCFDTRQVPTPALLGWGLGVGVREIGTILPMDRNRHN